MSDKMDTSGTISGHVREMTATDELRRLLDERGVEWGNVRNDGSESDYFTEWQFDGIEGHAIATEWAVGQPLTVCIAHPMTPAQAIDATLGPGTCRDVGRYAFVCSECGETFGDGRDQVPRYCPGCGRAVNDD